MKRFYYLIFLIFFVQIIFSNDAQWPLIYFDSANTSRSPNDGPQSLSLNWYSKDYGHSCLLLNENEIITIKEKEIFKVNSNSGDIIWITELDDLLLTVPVIGNNGYIYCVTSKFLYCIEENNGNLIWMKEFHYILNSFLIVDNRNRIFIKDYEREKNSSKIIAIDGNSGNLLWSYSYQDIGISRISTVVDEEGNSYFIDFGILAFDQNGNKLWEKFPDEIGNFLDKPFIYKDGILYCVSLSGYFCGIKKENGETLFKVSLSPYFFRTPPSNLPYISGCIGSNENIYIAFEDFILEYERNGNLIKAKGLYYKNPTSIISANNGILYLILENKVLIFNNDLEILSEYKLPFEISFSMLSLSRDEKLYLGTNGGLFSFSSGNFIYSNYFLIPISANSAGANSTNWKTDLFLTNPTYDTAKILISLLKSNEDNRFFSTIPIDLAPRTSISLKNVLSLYFSFEGTGSLLIQSNIDKIIVNSRTYNDINGKTYGQFIPSISYDELLFDKGLLTPLIENEKYRTNIGFSNFSEFKIEIQLEFFNGGGVKIGTKEILVLPLSHIQLNQVLKEFCQENCENYYVEFKSKESLGSFAAYASIVDNSTGDAIFIPFQKIEGNWY